VDLGIYDAVVLKKNGKVVLATKKGLLYLEIHQKQNKLKSISTPQPTFKQLKDSPCGYFLVAQDTTNNIILLDSATLQIILQVPCTFIKMTFSSEYIFIYDAID